MSIHALRSGWSRVACIKQVARVDDGVDRLVAGDIDRLFERVREIVTSRVTPVLSVSEVGIADMEDARSHGYHVWLRVAYKGSLTEVKVVPFYLIEFLFQAPSP